MNEDDRRAELATAVREPPGPGQLARACLLVARGEHPELDADACDRTLDDYAERVRSHDRAEPWYALHEVLGLEAGFRGDVEQYENPVNSYLNLVLERRRGLPILLSVVWIEVARRAGLGAHGIGLPGHFIVSVGGDAGATLVDPFDSGTRMTPDEALARGAAAMGQPSGESSWLRPVTADALIARVLTNLAGSYERRSDDERLERVLSDMLALDPGALATRVRRGEVRGRRKDVHGALQDLNVALATLPPGPTFDHIRAVATRLARLGSSLN